MTGIASGKPSSIVYDPDDFDLTTERLVAPEINNPWWPHSIPTDGSAHAK